MIRTPADIFRLEKQDKVSPSPRTGGTTLTEQEWLGLIGGAGQGQRPLPEPVPPPSRAGF
jgi:hypothetical protein